MINYKDYSEIHFCFHKLEMNKSQIAQSLNLSPTTVSFWLAKDKFTKSAKRKTTSKLDVFKPRILQLLAQCPDYSGKQILHLITAEGFDGGKSIVNDYLKSIRPKARKAYLSLHFPPGDSAQVDWGVAGYINIDGVRRKVSYFVMVLCYSRMIYVEFTLGEAQEFWLTCHENAFKYFGGVPKKVMVDNCKTAVISHCSGEDVVFNSHYQDFSNHYGFYIVACNVRQPQEKGRVENAVGYVRKNFLVGRRLEPFELLNIEVIDWLKMANERIHGTTNKQPISLLSEEKLQGFGKRHAYICCRKIPVKINKLFRVRFAGNTYSVPSEYAFEDAIINVFCDRISIHSKGREIAVHNRYFGSKKDIEDPMHSKNLIQTRKRASEQKILNWLQRLSPKAHIFYKELQAHSLDTTGQLNKISALQTTYTEQEIAMALEDCIKLSAFSVDYMRNILHSKRQQLPEAGPLHVSHNADQLNLRISAPNLSLYEEKLR